MKKYIIRLCLWILAKIGYSTVPLEMEQAARREIAELTANYGKQVADLNAQLKGTVASFKQEKSSLLEHYDGKVDALRGEMKAKLLKAQNLLPEAVEPFHAELLALCTEEMPLDHGSTDVALGNSWLKLRRVATKMRMAHPNLRKRDVFRAVIIAHEEVENVQA